MFKQPTPKTVVRPVSAKSQIKINTINPKDSKNKPKQAIELNLANPQISKHDQKEQTLKKLIDMNENYLYQKIKISDTPKPSRYSHKMPSKTGNSQYTRKYASVNRSYNQQDATPKRDKVGSLVLRAHEPIAGYESTYHMDFALKKQEDIHRSQSMKINKKYEKSQAPNFNQTSYNRDYGTVTQSPTTTAKRIEVRLMGGGKLATGTTYKQNYKAKTQTIQVAKPIIHKDNRIFIQMEAAHKSIGKKITVESCKPVQKYKPGGNKMKYKTEYNQTFIGQNIFKKHDFDCLSHEQLKNYVMNILND